LETARVSVFGLVHAVEGLSAESAWGVAHLVQIACELLGHGCNLARATGGDLIVDQSTKPVDRPPEVGERLMMAQVEDFPHEKRTISHLPPVPPRFIWPRIRRVLGIVIRLSLLLTLSVVCYFVFTRRVIRSVQVSGESMYPTLNNGDRYLLNLWASRDYTPQRGDIVILRDPVADCFAVKRVIGFAGESIYFNNGNVFVNNQPLPESYLPKWQRTFPSGGVRSELYILGTNRFFVMGDNRDNSADSREYGPVPRENIVGKLNEQ
jgi:signal peptidase I